jgi:CDP-paratose 2-epimerase
MPTAIVTGSGGLIGSESVARLVELGFEVVGLENDMRARFFGAQASTAHMTDALLARFPDAFVSLATDIRDRDGVERVFAERAGQIELVIHTAAQPSHDWAASDPHTDFEVNALGTLNLLQATRQHADGATFVFCSTNKVYGDTPNALPLVEFERRLELGGVSVWIPPARADSNQPTPPIRQGRSAPGQESTTVSASSNRRKSNRPAHIPQRCCSES